MLQTFKKSLSCLYEKLQILVFDDGIIIRVNKKPIAEMICGSGHLSKSINIDYSKESAELHNFVLCIWIYIPVT